MNLLQLLREKLFSFSDMTKALSFQRYFKNCKKDRFLGVKAPIIHQLAREFSSLTLSDVYLLMHSEVHEERSLAHDILCRKFRKASDEEQREIFEFYLENRSTICEWDGVDNSAPYIVGPYLLKKKKTLLYQLARSESLWDRRIAIVSTWHFIRQGVFADTLKLAEMLLHDREDLIHKATGWMLREVGKRDLSLLTDFLDRHAKKMPRTMLRYAIEKLSSSSRKYYLIK